MDLSARFMWGLLFEFRLWEPSSFGAVGLLDFELLAV